MTEVLSFSGLECRLTGIWGYSGDHGPGMIISSFLKRCFHHPPGDDHFPLFFRVDNGYMKIAFYRFRFAGFPCRGAVLGLWQWSFQMSFVYSDYSLLVAAKIMSGNQPVYLKHLVAWSHREFIYQSAGSGAILHIIIPNPVSASTDQNNWFFIDFQG